MAGMKVSGLRDYLDQKLVYQFNPVVTATSPATLLSPDYIIVSTSYIYL
jgi:hypothetical protein